MANFLQRVTRSLVGSISTPNAFIQQLFGGTTTVSGEQVSSTNAPEVVAVYACVKLISDTIASLPFHVYEIQDYGKELKRTHPLDKLISKRPNVKYSSIDFRRAAIATMLLRGNAYILPIREGNYLKELELIDPDNVTVEYKNGELVYTVYIQANYSLKLKPDQIIHLKAFTLDGYTGLSPIAYAKETIGTAKSATKHLGQYYGKGTVPPGLLELRGVGKDPETLKKIGQQFDNAVKSGRTPVLPEGAEYKGITMSLRDGQFIETMKYSTEEICRLYGVPPHKVGVMEHGVYNNSIEAQNAQFVMDCIRPLVEMVEDEFENKLLNNSSLCVEMDIASLMRGDIQTQVQRDVSYWNIGAINVNEIRANMGLPPIDDGNEYFKPMHMSAKGDIQNGEINKESNKESGAKAQSNNPSTET